MIDPHLIAKYGRVGSRVPGSKFYRDYCVRCQEPLRVTGTRIGLGNYCEACDPPHIGVGNPTPGMGIDKDPDAYAPAWKAGN